MNISMLGFSARMAAGKTVVSNGVALAMGAKRIAFGGVVREEAGSRGIAATRENLQDLGESLVQEDVDAFCLRALDRNGWTTGSSIVVDGVRHVRVLDKLREMVEPNYFGLMYLNVDRETQLQRWKTEDLPYTKSLQELESHPTEIEVLTTLPQRADLVLDGKQTIDRIVRDVIRWSTSNSLLGDWEMRNERRILLTKKSIDGSLATTENEELDLLQASFAQYLAIQYDPYQRTTNSHRSKLEALQSRYGRMKSEE